YNIKDISNKEKNKRVLLEKYHIPFSEQKPLLAVISNISDDDSFHIVKKIFHELMELDIYFILMGERVKTRHRFFEDIKKKYVGRVGIDSADDHSLAHLIKAGADIFLGTSKSESCGLNQLSSLKYGTVPVVYSNGEEYDSIRTFNSETGKGTGFVFHRFDSKHILKAVKQAVKMYHDKKTWYKIMRNGMREDFSWSVASKRYIQLYGKCISKRK
ncbi:glycosyltransferase, partial [bacterium]|nr:glycosyltransferase [bacterium]